MNLALDAQAELRSLDLMTMDGQRRAKIMQDSCILAVEKWQGRIESLSAHLKANCIEKVQEA